VRYLRVRAHQRSPNDFDDDSDPKPRHDAALDRGRIADAGQERWEHDPIVFTARDRDAIRNYYRGAAARVPHGLAKRNGNLPPGLRKHLYRNGVLPPGLQKRFEPLSENVERHLKALDSGYSRGRIGQDVVIVEDRTQRIMDIIRDVSGRR
jgi:hypothetical protein